MTKLSPLIQSHKAKEYSGTKAFVYSFKMMDLDSKMYVAFGMTMTYLRQYYLRNNSESGFSADKRCFGWKVAQKRDDRIDTALNCTGVWHNLMNLYPD